VVDAVELKRNEKYFNDARRNYLNDTENRLLTLGLRMRSSRRKVPSSPKNDFSFLGDATSGVIRGSQGERGKNERAGICRAKSWEFDPAFSGIYKRRVRKRRGGILRARGLGRLRSEGFGKG